MSHQDTTTATMAEGRITYRTQRRLPTGDQLIVTVEGPMPAATLAVAAILEAGIRAEEAVVTVGVGVETPEAALSLNQLAASIRADQIAMWPGVAPPVDQHPAVTYMMMVSEIVEAMEGERRDLMDDHLPHRKMAEVEMADLLLRALAYCAKRNFDIDGALAEKRAYNLTRSDHSTEERAKPNGKRW